MNFNKLKNNFFLLSIWFSIIIFFIVFNFTSKILIWNNLNINYKIQEDFSNNKVSKDIVLVKIDENTTNKLWWPFNRLYYIKTIENLKKAWAKTIALDILFLDNTKNLEKNIKNNNTDEKLALAFKKNNVIIWWKIRKNWSFDTPIFLDKNFSKLKLKDKKYYKNSVKKVAYYNPTINKYTGQVLSFIPYTKLKNGLKIEHISFAALRDFLWFDDEIKWFNKLKNIYYLGNKKIITNNKQFFINFKKEKTFKTESFYNVYTWNFKKDFFKNKLVFIGYTVEWAQDKYNVPKLWNTKWIYIILNAINSVLQDEKIVFSDKNIEKIIIFLVIFFTILLTFLSKNSSKIKWLFLWAISIFTIYFWIYFIIYNYFLETEKKYIFLNYPLEFIISIFLAFFIATIMNFLTEDKNKKLLNKALWEYVSKDIAKEILSWEWKIKLNWEKKDIAIFFSDIEWFTSISEKMSPERLVDFLKKYLWESSEIIMQNRWYIDKYEWDAIMALFWIFWETYKTKDKDILESALLQKENLKELNKIFKNTIWTEIKVRMWIHSWEAIIWNIWASWKKMEFTALWDNVNLASRLEWVNKFYSTYICCSQTIYESQKENYVFRFLDYIKVKWKQNWVKIYELIWRKNEVSEKTLEKIKIFEKALEFYFKKDWQKAIEFFEKSEKMLDKTSSIFIYRCKYFLKNPPKDNWNWIWEMKEK